MEHQDKPKQNSHDEWAKKIMAVSEVHKKEQLETEIAEEKTERKKGNSIFAFIFMVLLFLMAIIARMYFIFYVSVPDNPGAGWFGDAYHHWQIAYLTKEIGLSHGFLRLWDLKGMEYFWGLLHPVIMLIAFSVTGIYTVGLERAVTALFGSISVVLVFLIARRTWNTKTAIAAALFAALNPVGVFNDGTGMVEPLGIPFLLLGVYLWPRVAWLAGISFAIALMARAEYWMLAIALVAIIAIFSKEKSDKKIAFVISFIVVFGIYMKYLLNWTNNPIYPFYENYMANYVGTWQFKEVLSPEDIMAKYTFLAIFIISVISSILIIWKKPKGMYFYLLGLGNWMFLGAVFGLGQYIKSYMSYVWYVRFMILPYIFVGVVLAVILFYYIPKIKYVKIINILQLNWIIFLSILLVSQAVWIPIWNKYKTTIPTWNNAVTIADNVAKNYHGGGLLLFEGNPEITYALVRYHGVEGKNIVGQMFDPYFYFKGDPYDDWGKKRKVVLKWLKDNKIRTIATYMQSERYAKLAERESDYISEPVAVPNTNMVIYQIKDELYQQDF